VGLMGMRASPWPVLLAPLAAVAAAVIIVGPGAAAGAAQTRGMTARANLARQAIAYVTAGGPHYGTVTPILTATNTTLKPVKVGQNPSEIAVTPNGKTVYVSNTNLGTVTPIRTATNKALRPIKAGTLPEAIAIAP
jgi:YVTN family beta-propeller protein